MPPRLSLPAPALTTRSVIGKNLSDNDTETPAPTGLSPEALTLWKRWHDELNDDDLVPDGRESAILAEACRHLTIATRLETALAVLDDIIVPGSRGNPRVTPLVGEIDKVRRTVSSLLASIKAPVDRSAINKANGGSRWANRA